MRIIVCWGLFWEYLFTETLMCMFVGPLCEDVRALRPSSRSPGRLLLTPLNTSKYADSHPD